jgi:hypothetical protein
MMNEAENLGTYAELRTAYSEKYAFFKKRYQLIGSVRLLIFSCIAVMFFFFWGETWLLLPAGMLSVLFFYFINVSLRVKYQRDKHKELIHIVENELAVLAGNWSAFKNGEAYKSSQHAYALDMDLFGPKSIFQLINRTTSNTGSDLLAAHLMKGSSKAVINSSAIEELSHQIEWCQAFMAEAVVLKSDDDNKHLAALTRSTPTLSSVDHVLRFAQPLIAIGATLLFNFNIISTTSFSIITLLLFAVIGRNFKKSTPTIAFVTSYSFKLKMLQRQFEHLKKINFQEPAVEAFQQALIQDQGFFGSIQNLGKLINGMEFRMNLLVGSVLNFFLAWDLQLLHRWNKWSQANADKISAWEQDMARIEVWISLACYRFNFPSTCFAQIDPQSTTIAIKELGHPFVGAAKCVKNDFITAENENFQIITGPNMAGKSTFLRSVGLSIIFANAGFPVYAKSCTIPRIKLYTSMRTSDDLNSESSYFHAELTRLRFIMDAIEQGEPIFVILDEILKGTNSKDKEIGSKKFLAKLNALGTKGIIATHDLALCELANESSQFNNQYFDSTILLDEISFDYKIRQGICQNMNASFLLKKMALID